MDFLRSLDEALFSFINSTLSHPWLDWFFPFLTDLNKTLAFKVLVPIGVLMFLFRKYRAKGFILFIGLLITIGVTDWSGTTFGKNVFERARPFQVAELHAIKRADAGGYSFPSNHASNLFAFATFLSPFFPAASPYLYSVAALTAYSRVYCGVHFPGDVIAGALWGIFLGLIFAKIFQRFVKPRPS